MVLLTFYPSFAGTSLQPDYHLPVHSVDIVLNCSQSSSFKLTICINSVQDEGVEPEVLMNNE